MKIGLVCPYNIYKGGGVQEGVLAIQRELIKRGHEAKIITPTPRKVDTDTNPNIIFIGAARDIRSPFATTAQVSVSVNTDDIEHALSKEKFDVLHFHEPWVPIMSRQILARSTSINVATFHAHLPDTMVSKTVEAVITPYTKPLLKHLHGLTAVSDAAAEYVKTLTDQNIEIIPNGINLKKYQVARNPNSEKMILYIGRLEKRKGVKYLLKAFEQLAEDDSNVRLVIAGDGPDKQKLQELVHENHIDRVDFLGYISEEDKLSLLSEADVLCSPALYGESFGIVLLEAMAAGVPVVAGDNPGYRTVMKERGKLSLLNPKDTDEFTRRLSIFLSDSDIKRLWCEWASNYVEQFDYPNVIDMYEAFYLKLLANK
jgi:phosphatidyl-myo-inositol alpha-mannosyltransferase